MECRDYTYCWPLIADKYNLTCSHIECFNLVGYPMSQFCWFSVGVRCLRHQTNNTKTKQGSYWTRKKLIVAFSSLGLILCVLVVAVIFIVLATASMSRFLYSFFVWVFFGKISSLWLTFTLKFNIFFKNFTVRNKKYWN